MRKQGWAAGQGAKGLAANAYTVYLIHPLVLVSFAYTFHTVALYPLLKFGIAVLIALPLCFLASLFIRKIPLADRIFVKAAKIFYRLILHTSQKPPLLQQVFLNATFSYCLAMTSSRLHVVALSSMSSAAIT